MDHQNSLISSLVIGAVIVLLVATRMRRLMQSRPLNPRNLWIVPTVLLLVTLGVLSRSPPSGRGWLWVVVGFLLGAGLGWLRARTIRLTFDPSTGQVMAQGTALAVVFILALFVVRFGLRSLLTQQSVALGLGISAIDGAFLAMACGLFGARSLEMAIRARRLAAPPTASGR